jgi:autotransporter-associated beta strand protein
MKNIPLQAAVAFLLAAAPLTVTAQTTFFTDSFTGGSSLDSTTLTNTTATSTSYQMVSSKSWSPTPSINSHDLKIGIASSSSGDFEAQALFATNAVALTQPGDYIQLTVVFTNTSGILVAAGQLGFGLYNSGQVKPIAGGLNGTATTSTASELGGAQGWQGYVGQINYGSSASRIMTRPAQTIITGNDQDLITSGSSSSSYSGSTTVGSTVTENLTSTAGTVYTNVLTITLLGTSSVAVTNSLYLNTSATPVAFFGGVATNTTFLTGGFDSLAIGYRAGATGPSNTMDIASIVVSGSVTTISGPPLITSEPTSVTVSSGNACAFLVAAQGFDVTYQWHRHGTNLVDGGNVSGSTTSMLVVSPASSADVLSGANGYYVTVTGAGPYSTNSITNSLSLVTMQNLIYSGSGDWDLDTSASWLNTSLNGGYYFNFGDAVTFDDNGAGGTVTLDGPFLSASSVTINEDGSPYTFTGTGSFAGPGKMIYEGIAQFTVNNANTYTGGTIISNATANLRLENLAGLGTGPITMALAGGQMEIMTAASASTGINSDLILADDFSFVVDPVDSSYSVVLNGNLSGTAGKTLTVNHGSNGSGTNVTRIRIYGTNTVFNANLLLNDSTFLWAPYQASGSQTYNGVISGAGALMEKGTISYFNGANTYSGGMNISAGAIGLGIDSVGSPGSVSSGPIGTGPLLLTIDSTTATTGSSQIFASGGAHILYNAIQYPSGTNNLTLVVGGSQNLTLAGPITLNGNDNVTSTNFTARTIQPTNTAATIISGVISDNGLNYGLIKTGPGALYLDAANTYTGSTTNNSNSTNSPGLLAGAGTIVGPVFVQTNSAIGGGSAAGIGTLTLNSSLTLAGNGWFRVQKGLTQSNDMVDVGGTLSNVGTGTITVTNLGATVVAGDQFYLFNKAVSGGSTMAVTGAGMVWTNLLAVNGSIKALSVTFTTAAYATNITASVTGTNLSIGWPATHLGWILQSQTNALSTGLTTATNTWFDLPGTSSVTQTNLGINPKNPTVLYRLRHP